MRYLSRIVCMLMVLVIAQSVLFAKEPFVPPWVEQTKNKKEKKLEIRKQFASHPKLEEQTPQLTVEKGEFPSYEKEEIEVAKPPLEIDGIICSDAGMGVFISGTRIYKVGDKIGDGCIVKRITPNKVIVRCGNNFWSYTVEGVEDHEVY